MTAPPPRNPNRVRDHLANERTFLAWVRTALALIGLGFVLARMGLFLRQLTAMGVVADGHHVRFQAGGEFLISGVIFLVFGVALCGWSGRRYRQTLDAIEAENFEPTRAPIVAITGLVVIGGLALVALVVWRTLVSGATP